MTYGPCGSYKQHYSMPFALAIDCRIRPDMLDLATKCHAPKIDLAMKGDTFHDAIE